MAGLSEASWLLAKQKPQNGTAAIDVFDEGRQNECSPPCGCCCQIGIAVCWEQNQEENAFLPDNLIDDEELEPM